MGCSHNLYVSITGIKDQFALEGEKLTQEYAALALGTAFHPYFVGSTFDPEAVGIEKQMLKKALEDEVNDKRLYCQRQANREFFGDSPAGVRQEGYLEEVDGLTPETLTEAYNEMLRTANIELIVLGCDEASTTAVKDALLTELSAIDRAPLPRAENIAMPRREPVRKVEHFDTTQAKLCMLFTLGRPMQPEQLAAVRLAMALYGGSVTSRLFLNVRERRPSVATTARRPSRASRAAWPSTAASSTPTPPALSRRCSKSWRTSATARSPTKSWKTAAGAFWPG